MGAIYGARLKFGSIYFVNDFWGVSRIRDICPQLTKKEIRYAQSGSQAKRHMHYIFNNKRYFYLFVKLHKTIAIFV